MLEHMTFSPTPNENLEQYIRTVQDFPKPGISFKDITPLLADPQAFAELISRMTHEVREAGAECVVGLESRGFILGIAVAQELGLPFIPARKPGKLPAETVGASYDLEYGSATLQIHKDALTEGQKVAIVDDLLATGGTAEAATRLVEQLGAEVCGCFFAIELIELQGRRKLQGQNLHSIMELS